MIKTGLLHCHKTFKTDMAHADAEPATTHAPTGSIHSKSWWSKMSKQVGPQFDKICDGTAHEMAY